MRKDLELQISKKIDERGAALVEYALLVALIAVMAIGAVRYFGEKVRDSFLDTAQVMVSGDRLIERKHQNR